MKKQLFLMLLMMATTTMNAQTIVKGDMNGDGQVTVADITSVANVAVGRTPIETLSVSTSPFAVDNSYVVGTWYKSDGSHFTLSQDGTTDYPGGASYRFYPGQNRLLILNASGKAVQVIPIVEATSSYLLAVDYATGDLTYYANSASLVTSISLSQTSLIMNSNEYVQLTATASPSEALHDILWTSSDEGVATVDNNGLVTGVAGGTCTITATATDGSGTFATCEVTIVQLVTSITLSKTKIALEIDGYKKLIATVLPANASNPSVTWSSSNEDVAEVARNGGVSGIGHGICTITCTAQDGSGVSTTCEVYVDMGVNFEGDHGYVDLGLPSGTLWATCNVGADIPEGYGNYFAWGETDTKSDYSWGTYKYCMGDEYTLTKYCNKSYYGNNGFTDNLTELEPEDDAATANWGSAWRMPSEVQFEELINSNYTTTEWINQNGVYGCKITSKISGYIDNFIFLPVVGHREDSSLYETLNGDYWSRTLGTSFPSSTWHLFFIFLEPLEICTENISGYRYCGRSVRPVRAAQQ